MVGRASVPTTALLLAAALVPGACGYKGQVTRIEPAGMERAALKEARAAEAAAIAGALNPSPEQRPVRIDDITIRLEDRRDDPFNLPPE